MFKRILLVTSLFSMLLLGALTVNAQDGGAIAYGDTVQGEISNTAFEVEYKFEGTEGDLIVAIMADVDGVLGDFEAPGIILLGPDNAIITSVEESFTNQAILPAKLPSTGSYTLIATREGGRAGESVGSYNLTLIQPTLIEGTVEGSVSSEGVAFYALETDQSFTLDYQKTGGEFNPRVQVSVIGEDGRLDEIGSLEGARVDSGSIGIAAGLEVSYFITLDEALFDFNFDEVTANFTLTATERTP